MLRVLPFFKYQFHRHALHHLDVVAGGIFGRKQAEARPGSSANAVHVGAIVAVVSVHVNRRGLAGVHVLQLIFLEVDGHPDVIQRHDGHKRLAGLHNLP